MEIDIQTVELMTPNSGDLIPGIIVVQSKADDLRRVVNMVVHQKQMTFLEWLIQQYESLQ